jgi:acyl-CoA synthetase (AMP-forming)/AMP-acid ligase II
MKRAQNLGELVHWRAERLGMRRAYSFLQDAFAEEEHEVSYAELETRSQRVAGFLQKNVPPQARVLVLLPPGLDYLFWLFGCMISGYVCVPSYSPVTKQDLVFIDTVIADCEPGCIVAADRTIDGLKNAGLLKRRPRITLSPATPTRCSSEWRDSSVDANDLALLQYTSGSTGHPKAVMVSHANILANLRSIAFALTGVESVENQLDCDTNHSSASDFVFWLPPFHDLGLVGGILTPLFMGRPAALMSPLSFLKRPLRWLKAMSRHRAVYTAAPNFAFDICVRHIAPTDIPGLNLESLRVAIVSTEPVRLETLRAFASKFAPAGFQFGSFSPSYGLAEATLIVTGGLESSPLRTHCNQDGPDRLGLGAQLKAVGSDRRELVGCGCALPNEKVVIADPASGNRLGAFRIGEVWLSSPSVARGYWNRPEQTSQTFHAYLRKDNQGPFLRTGDLGFLDGDGHLFLVGRLKDLIVIRGKKYVPEDIEASARASSPILENRAIAAFSTDAAPTERLTIVCEVVDSTSYNHENLRQQITRQIMNDHLLETSAIFFVREGTIPRTTSGKIRRSDCRRQVLNGRLLSLSETRDKVRQQQATFASGASVDAKQ